MSGSPNSEDVDRLKISRVLAPTTSSYAGIRVDKQSVMYWLPLLLAFLVSGTTELTAQEARSFEQLQLLVKPDDTITVLEITGKVTKGRIVQLTDSTLQLMTDGVLRELPQNRTMQIRQKREDSLSNGAKYGALVGGGLGALMAAGLYIMVDHCIGCAVAVGAGYSAMGAGVGVGIDALIRRERVIFTPAPASSRVTIRPLLSAQRRGVSLSWAF
jgi:hypothetical protein